MEDEQKISTTDQAIMRCEEIIKDHSKQASRLLLLILGITYTFIILIASPYIKSILGSSENNISNENVFITKLNSIDSLNTNTYDSLINKAITFQKLLNYKEGNIRTNSSNGNIKEKLDSGNFIIYGLFILIFGVLTSLYRFHLKEISRQEHYLIGFQRIRIAGVNSSTKYDDEVKTALTKNAFYFEPDGKSKNEKQIQSPIQGYPTSDITTNLLNKLLERFDFTPKK